MRVPRNILYTALYNSRTRICLCVSSSLAVPFLALDKCGSLRRILAGEPSLRAIGSPDFTAALG